MDILSLRSASPEDADELLAIYAAYVTSTAVSFEYEPPSLEEFQNRIEDTLAVYPYIVAEYGGEILGYSYASALKKRAAYIHSVETSIYLKRNMRRNGIGSMLYHCLENVLKAQGVLNLNACVASSPRENDAHLTSDSILFHEKMGYRLIGRFSKCGFKFNEWYDMVWMEKHIGTHGAAPPEFVPFSEARRQLGF